MLKHEFMTPELFNQKRSEMEWYIKLFLGVHFADNLA